MYIHCRHQTIVHNKKPFNLKLDASSSLQSRRKDGDAAFYTMSQLGENYAIIHWTFRDPFRTLFCPLFRFVCLHTDDWLTDVPKPTTTATLKGVRCSIWPIVISVLSRTITCAQKRRFYLRGKFRRVTAFNSTYPQLLLNQPQASFLYSKAVSVFVLKYLKILSCVYF